jgi:diguanylate cyclase (GGDEF)-like protein
VLKDFATIVSKELRAVDVFGRTGGEEFLISLPNTNSDQAKSIAERISESVRNSFIDCDGKKIRYTVSIGLDSTLVNESTELSHLMINADKAMYQAKKKGRNRVESFIAES